MKPNETKVTFIIDKDTWLLVKTIASKYKVVDEDGTKRQATGSDILRELLGSYLAEKTEAIQQILEDMRKTNVKSSLRTSLEEDEKIYKEGEK